MSGLLLLNEVALAGALQSPWCISKISSPWGVVLICGGSAMAELSNRESLNGRDSEFTNIVVQCLLVYWRCFLLVKVRKEE